jgi:predicted nucleic acid-binding protein
LTGAAFFDANTPLSLISGDLSAAKLAGRLLAGGGPVSVPARNGIVAAVRGKPRSPWPRASARLEALPLACGLPPLTQATQGRARTFAGRHGVHIDGVCIIAGAIAAGCDTLFRDGPQDGLRIASLTVQAARR